MTVNSWRPPPPTVPAITGPVLMPMPRWSCRSSCDPHLALDPHRRGDRGVRVALHRRRGRRRPPEAVAQVVVRVPPVLLDHGDDHVEQAVEAPPPPPLASTAPTKEVKSRTSAKRTVTSTSSPVEDEPSPTPAGARPGPDRRRSRRRRGARPVGAGPPASR